MARRLTWRRRACADIASIREHIARDSPANAKKVVAAIEQAANLLADVPYGFLMIPEFNDPNRRETFVHEYRLMYRIEDDRISILRVVQGRRLLGNVPGSFDEPGQQSCEAA
jgi:plasmid stabilization system protein ParE